MKFNTLTRRAAAAGGATALAAGALVGLTVTSASAAPQTITYSCPTDLGNLPVTLTTDIPALPTIASLGPYAAGSAVPAGTVPGGVTNHFVISDATKSALDSVGTSKISFTSFQGAFGNSAVPAVLSDVTPADMSHDSASGTWSFDDNGTQGAFNNPKAGTWDVFAPQTFTFLATTAAFGDVPVTCTAPGSAPSYGTQIAVVKNASKLKASSPNTPVPHGKKAVLKAKVSAPNHMPTGKVIFKNGTKTLAKVSLNAKGIAVLKAKLSKGTHTIKMIYKGDGYTTGSKGSVKVVQK